MTDAIVAISRETLVDDCAQQERLGLAGEHPDIDVGLLVRGFVDTLMEVIDSDND